MFEVLSAPQPLPLRNFLFAPLTLLTLIKPSPYHRTLTFLRKLFLCLHLYYCMVLQDRICYKSLSKSLFYNNNFHFRSINKVVTHCIHATLKKISVVCGDSDICINYSQPTSVSLIPSYNSPEE